MCRNGLGWCDSISQESSRAKALASFPGCRAAWETAREENEIKNELARKNHAEAVCERCGSENRRALLSPGRIRIRIPSTIRQNSRSSLLQPLEKAKAKNSRKTSSLDFSMRSIENLFSSKIIASID